jgi:hypothetical protein
MKTKNKAFRNIIGALLIPLLISAMTGCSDLDIKSELTFLMYAVNSNPEEGGSGELTPIYQTYKLESISLTSNEKAKIIWDASNHSDVEGFRIIERPQKLTSILLSDYNATNISPILFKFSSKVTGASKDNDNLSFELSSQELSYEKDFFIEEGRDYSLAIKVYWRDTISNDTMQQPQYVIEED